MRILLAASLFLALTAYPPMAAAHDDVDPPDCDVGADDLFTGKNCTRCQLYDVYAEGGESHVHCTKYYTCYVAVGNVICASCQLVCPSFSRVLP